jgi:Type I phosphodiesterase / nucleotide pyrophosphatase
VVDVSTSRLPERGSRCFDQLPATIERLLTGTTAGPALDEPLLRERFQRVALVYLDAFGWTFLERQHDHSLLRRARADGLVAQLTSQFPSTTTAHVTTIHSGLPVAEHGLYEWHLLEPKLNRLITPLLFSFAGDGRRETLAQVLPPEAIYPPASVYLRLAEHGIRSSVAQSEAFAFSSPNRVLLRGAEVLAFGPPEQGLAVAASALAARETGYALVYLSGVDSLMHSVGPDGPAADVAFAEALTLIERAPFPPGTLVLLTADHGMAPVDPARTVYVNHLWPELAEHLEPGADGKPLAPAGSCRDLFLHVRDGHLAEVCACLGNRLEGVADVVTAEALVATGAFAEPSAHLRARLGNVVVLPRYGEAVFWHEPGRFVQDLHGQHGGLSPQEMEIPLLAWIA